MEFSLSEYELAGPASRFAKYFLDFTEVKLT